MVTGMVNDPMVPLQELTKVACHTSVSAHMAYMSSERVSEGKKIEGLLHRNNVVTEKEKKPTKSDTCKVDYEPVKVFYESENTEEEFDAFQEEYRLLGSSHHAMLQVEHDFDTYMLESYPPMSQILLDTSTTASQQAVEMARANYDTLLLQNQQLSSATVQKRQLVVNLYAKKQKDVNPYLKNQLPHPDACQQEPST